MPVRPPDINVSPEVRQTLSPEMLQRVLAAPLARARCPKCRRPVPPAGPVNAIVMISGSDQRVIFAHMTCAPSGVMQADRPIDLASATGMNMTAVLMQDDSGPLTGLVGERKSPAYLHGRASGGELVDVGMADALNRGFALIARLDEVPRRELDWTATATATATAIGLGTHQLVINPGTLFYDGDVLFPPGWREITEWRGWCVLYTGTGLSDPETGDLTTERLIAAAAAGTLAGARLRITWA